MASGGKTDYIDAINAFKSDCKSLVDAYLETESENFKDFTPLWKSFGFNLIYEKYKVEYKGDFNTFKEDSLQIAKAIMFANKFVPGIYLLFGLHFIQEKPKAQIRLDLAEFQKLMDLLKEKRPTSFGNIHPGFIFGRLISTTAFTYVACPRKYTIEGQNRARAVFGDYMPPSRKFNVKDRKELRDNIIADGFGKLHEIDQKIQEQIKKLNSEFPSLNIPQCKSVVAGVEEWLEREGPSSSTPTEEDIGSKRQNLKNRKRKIKNRYKRDSSPPPQEAPKQLRKRNSCKKKNLRLDEPDLPRPKATTSRAGNRTTGVNKKNEPEIALLSNPKSEDLPNLL